MTIALLRKKVEEAERAWRNHPCPCGEMDRDCSTYHVCLGVYYDLVTAEARLREGEQKAASGWG